MKIRAPLSPAEEKLCRQIIGGLRIREIARIEGRSYGTVRNQLSGIYLKLEISGISQLAARFLEYELAREGEK